MSSERWHLFNGWAISRGIRPLELDSDDFLDLVHYYIYKGEYPETAVAKEPGKDGPPAWMGWKEPSSSHSDMLAAWEARQQQQ